MPSMARAAEGIKCSERLGVSQREQFQRALDRWDLGQFTGAEPVQEGLFGQNVFVTSSRGRFVLRGCPHADWQFPKERWFARRLHELGAVPAPWPYLLDDDRAIFGWPYVLMPRLEGEPAATAGQSQADKLAIARATGQTLGRLQELTWPCAGDYSLSSDTIVPSPGGLAARIADDMARCLACSCEKAPAVTAPDAAWARTILEGVWTMYPPGFQATFTQNDYKLGNMVASRDGNDWRISGLFDLMECYFGDGESDLARQATCFLHQPGGADLVREFGRGYRDIRPLRGGFEERIRLHILRDRLIMWDYGHSPGVGWFPADLRLRDDVESFFPCAKLLQE
ncbi:MAG: phosphotransferase family protein [Phycisphaerae bacterium]